MTRNEQYYYKTHVKSGKIIEKKCVICRKKFGVWNTKHHKQTLFAGMRQSISTTCGSECSRINHDKKVYMNQRKRELSATKIANSHI